MINRDFDNFDDHAETYREIHDKSISLSGTNSEYFSEYKIIELAKFENKKSKFSFLDFGCGDGNSSKFISRIFQNSMIRGIDVSVKSIEEAKEKKLDNCIFSSFNGTVIPFENNSFDIIFTSMVFHHISFDLHSTILNELYRVLKPGGRFYIFEHNPYNPLTRKVVRECPFDQDAVLLKPNYALKTITKANFKELILNFTIFIPRIKIFNWFIKLESLFRKIPVGAQYYIRAIK